ncbi:xylanase [Polaribacter sp. ALD11]|uniref:alpha/beta hydrolase n=1 Tax=Polaribacter sp. ALD11 TaxID=2058137 RepID=UPI000C310163|nr:alpha/beta hydrolase [Polaribacter sp. ALD11]AUC85427.1 xylanase [Polaribacter sp. ALD11]
MTNKIYISEDETPNQSKEKNEPKIAFDKNSNTTKLIEVTHPLIEVFKPEENNNNGKAILICPGGSYKILALDKEGTEPALWLNTLGYTAYVLQYRVPDNIEGAFNDVQNAFKIIKNKFNHTKVGVLGFSAGAHLCARLSTCFSKVSKTNENEIDAEQYKLDFSLLIYPAYLDLGENKSISPNLLQDKNVPPIFIFGTEDDAYFNSVLTFANYLKLLKSNFELQTLTSGGHGYGLRKGNKAAETWPSLVEKWLNSITE